MSEPTWDQFDLTTWHLQSGAPYQDKTNDADRLDDAVPPGGQYVYEWQVTDQASPTEDDEECLAWVYHSHVDTVRDTNTGLLGILLTCKPGEKLPSGIWRGYDRLHGS